MDDIEKNPGRNFSWGIDMNDGSVLSGLIGHSGFVGGNLLSARHWDRLYNSQNFRDMMGMKFGLLACAGISATKWRANMDPASDWAAIQSLMDALSSVHADHFLLVSSVDVFPAPVVMVDEKSFADPGPSNHYGRHRYQFEQWALGHFPSCSIVRLPGCFGPGLKKNALYDLLHGNMVDKIDPLGMFQFYDVSRIWDDSKLIIDRGIDLCHLAPMPVSIQSVAMNVFGIDISSNPSSPSPPAYDFRSCHDYLWGRDDGYMMDSDSVMRLIRSWALSSSSLSFGGRFK